MTPLSGESLDRVHAQGNAMQEGQDSRKSYENCTALKDKRENTKAAEAECITRTSN